MAEIEERLPDEREGLPADWEDVRRIIAGAPFAEGKESLCSRL